MHLYDIIITACNYIISKQRSDGSFEPGWNGPYKDPETPVRNTAHWLISLLKAYDLTGSHEFKHAAIKAADYLISPGTCPMNGSFYCRKNPQKDFSNGLIGQAWAIEALVIAAERLENEAYLKKALEVFEKHYFNEDLGLWRILNVDGSYNVIDMTFNHQLWFALAGAMLTSYCQSKNVAAKVIRFLDKANESNFTVANNGRIIHAVRYSSLVRRVGKFVLKSYRPERIIIEKGMARHKEIGYHGFNLYAFAVLKPLLPKHIFWKNKSLKKSLTYINDKYFFKSLEKNKYAYPYNPSGFEIALAIERFSEYINPSVHSPEWWVNKQMACCLDRDSYLMTQNTMDPVTLAARLYEATRLSNFKIELKK